MRIPMEEERETRKRKITNIDDEEEEEDEEVKIEKFFALIRSAKDIRDQLLDAEGSRTKPKKAIATEKKLDAVKIVRKPEKASAGVSKVARAAAAAVGGDSGGGAGRSSRSIREENNKGGGGDEKKNNHNNSQGGRMLLDLNLSL